MINLDTLIFLPLGYLCTILLEGSILLAGLSKKIPLSHRIFLSFWLTACTYPIVILVLPILLDISANRGLYIFMAESFAILAECFLLVWVSKPKYELNLYRDLTVVAVANLTSFIAGEIWWWQ